MQRQSLKNLVLSKNTKSFSVEDNRLDEENRIIELDKRLQQFEMEKTNERDIKHY